MGLLYDLKNTAEASSKALGDAGAYNAKGLQGARLSLGECSLRPPRCISSKQVVMCAPVSTALEDQTILFNGPILMQLGQQQLQVHFWT